MSDLIPSRAGDIDAAMRDEDLETRLRAQVAEPGMSPEARRIVHDGGQLGSPAASAAPRLGYKRRRRVARAPGWARIL